MDESTRAAAARDVDQRDQPRVASGSENGAETVNRQATYLSAARAGHQGESVRGLFTRTLGAGCPQRQQAVWRNPEVRLPGRLYPDQGTRAALARGGTATGLCAF